MGCGARATGMEMFEERRLSAWLKELPAQFNPTVLPTSAAGWVSSFHALFQETAKAPHFRGGE